MIATTYTIRSATEADHEAVVALWEAAGLGPTTIDEWNALHGGATNAVLVADDDGDVAGATVATFDGWRAYIYHAAVAAGHRKVGIGRALMREAEQYLASAGARYVYVMVHDENTEGLALVASSGYLPDGDMVLTKRLASGA